MPVNTENIKKALDAFTDDDFVIAKDILSQEIRGATDSFLHDKLGLKELEDDLEDEDGEVEEE